LSINNVFTMYCIYNVLYRIQYEFVPGALSNHEYNIYLSINNVFTMYCIYNVLYRIQYEFVPYGIEFVPGALSNHEYML